MNFEDYVEDDLTPTKGTQNKEIDKLRQQIENKDATITLQQNRIKQLEDALRNTLVKPASEMNNTAPHFTDSIEFQNAMTNKSYILLYKGM